VFTIIRQRRTFLVAMAAAAGVVLCCGCSSNGIGEALEELKIAKYGDDHDDGFVDPSTVTRGKFTDSRDGTEYKTVKIGKQTWMAENLNKDMANSWCYKDSADSCVKYGKLYNWSAATTACPSGWHLPSSKEWDKLMTAVGGSSTAGKKLKSTFGWNDYYGESGNGTDVYGFSALPGGGRYSSGFFGTAGGNGYWWTATDNGGGDAYRRNMYYYGDYVYEGNDNDKGYGCSVRCVKD